MSYSSSKIELLLINDRSAKDGNQDDKVVIRKNLEYNDFEVTYTERSGLDEPTVYSSTGMYREKVLDYIYMVVKNQYADDEPYHHVQLNIPAMPRVILSASKFKEVYFREHLYDLISTGLDLLETTKLVKNDVLPTPNPNAPSVSNNHNYYGDGRWPSARSSVGGAVPQHLYWD